MADHPVVRIALDTSAYDAFREKFAQFKQVAQRINPFAVDNEGMKEHQKHIDKLNKMLEVHKEKMRGVMQGWEEGKTSILSLSYSWTIITSQVKKFWQFIHQSTLSLAKWVGLTSLFSAIVAGGGLYGIMRFGTRVTQDRATALGFGVTPGQREAFNVAFGRFGNPDRFLEGYTGALTSVRKRPPLAGIPGIGNLSKMNSAQAFVASLPGLRSMLKRTDDSALQQVFIEGRQLGTLGWTVNDLMMLKRMDDSEYEDLIRWYKDLLGPLGMGRTGGAWATLMEALDSVGVIVETIFARNLQNLKGPVLKLTDVFVDLLTHLLEKGSPLSKYILKFAHWLEDLTGRMQGQGFKEALHQFSKASRQFLEIIGSAAMQAVIKLIKNTTEIATSEHPISTFKRQAQEAMERNFPTTPKTPSTSPTPQGRIIKPLPDLTFPNKVLPNPNANTFPAPTSVDRNNAQVFGQKARKHHGVSAMPNMPSTTGTWGIDDTPEAAAKRRQEHGLVGLRQRVQEEIGKKSPKKNVAKPKHISMIHPQLFAGSTRVVIDDRTGGNAQVSTSRSGPLNKMRA